MRAKLIAIGLAAACLLGAAGYGLYRLGMTHGMDISSPAAASRAGSAGGRTAAGAPMNAGDIDPATGKRVLYWHDPMVPGRRFERPGKSPFMDMMLVPVYEGDGDQGQITVSPRVQQNLGIRTAEVVRSEIVPRIEVAGNVAFNERDQAIVPARATAYVERLHVRATLDRVEQGQPLAELYVPDWVAAQEEFLSVRRMRGTDLAELVDAARQRMRQAGMTEAQIQLVETSNALRPRITLTAPIDGVVVELMAREGMTIKAHNSLFRINGLSTVWVNAEVPETQAGLLRPGAPVEARSPALPGRTFEGEVQAILPEIDPGTRTIRARIELENRESQLAPGMFVTVGLGAQSMEALMVPTEAVIQTGRRTVVMLAEANGTFRPVDVEIGIEANGQTEIKRGLEAGQRVVVSGQFLIDSEASLRATSTRMDDSARRTNEPRPGDGAPLTNESIEQHTGEGKIEALDDDSVTLSHGPIPSLRWGSMTMEFQLPAGAAGALETGASVEFDFRMGDDGRPVITRIEPMQ